MSKKNIVIGSILILLFVILGVALKGKSGSGGEEWKQSPMRHLLRVAHIHGGLFAMLNVIYGLVVINFKLRGKIIFSGTFLIPSRWSVYDPSLDYFALFYSS